MVGDNANIYRHIGKREDAGDEVAYFMDFLCARAYVPQHLARRCSFSFHMC